MYQLNIHKQTIIIRGIVYTPADISQKGISHLPEFEQSLFSFLKEWFTSSSFITVHTSGSTGIPKTLTVRKEQMMQSAQITCSFLKLQQKDKALLCLPLSYIAGKMMVVRALVAGLDLYPVEPSGNPLKGINTTLQFAAMIPLQVFNTWQTPDEKASLERIEKLIIGGGAIDPQLNEWIQTLPGAVYSTYGMTETLSHIALRRLNGTNTSSGYTPFPSVAVSLSEEGTLIIDAPLVCNEKLETNDIACIHPNGQFEILGRKDNIINSGGVKIQIEAIENALRPIISTTFAITAQTDPKFGEIVVLLIEAPANADTHEIEEKIRTLLPPYQQPKKIMLTEKIPTTESGKPNRAAIKQIINIK